MMLRSLLQLSAGIVLGLFHVSAVDASTLVTQTAVPGSCIPQFAVSMPVFGPAGPIPRVNTLFHPKITVTMQEINQNVLTGLTNQCDQTTFGPTRVWAYGVTDTKTNKVLAPPNWPGVTIESWRFLPTTVTYVNKLPQFKSDGSVHGPGLVQGLLSVDKTIHWADPLNVGSMNPCMDKPSGDCGQPYGNLLGETPPAVPHLHGAEDSANVDGGPDAWFTPDGIHGTGYYSADPADLVPTNRSNKAVYKYLNDQEPGTLWFHDHALGATRTNVYSGLEAFYFINPILPFFREPVGLPNGPYDIEMAIQDRQFDTDGQLFFPDGSGDTSSNLNGPPTNPDTHKFWNPEFIGDVAVVNGAPWPVLNVEPRRYLFRLLDGSNARFYNMSFGAAPVYVTGADDGYLDKPVPVKTVFMAPGERFSIIVDFTKLAGQTIDVTNDAMIPYPVGLAPGDPGQEGMNRIMRFVVGSKVTGIDRSCDPAIKRCGRLEPLVRLTDGQGHLAAGVKIDKVRRLILKEFSPPAGGGPLFVLVNNTYWDGTRSPGIGAPYQNTVNGVTELPQQGSTELWEIVNLTMDAHPMHTHLTQFQILNREPYTLAYQDTWGNAFIDPNDVTKYICGATVGDPNVDPGNPCPGYGTPAPYDTQVTDSDPILTTVGLPAIGGNPAIGTFLSGTPRPPAPEESGWKDTAKAMPGEVLRIVVRWTPTSVKVKPNMSYAGQNLYRFDPTENPGTTGSYVWHCHIIDHEDNEMMRPYKVVK